MEDPELSQAVKTKASYHRAPADVRARVRASVRAAGDGVSAIATWGWLRTGAAFALGLALAFALTLEFMPRAGTPSAPIADPLTSEIAAGHIRSLMASHLTDVASSDQHSVKPWFNGRVEFSPPVADLAAQGFPLAGGRLDFLGGHSVAALVYRHRAHPINLFVWPESGADLPSAADTQLGYHIVQWRRAGTRYAAVSDLNPDELGIFVALIAQGTAAQQ